MTRAFFILYISLVTFFINNCSCDIENVKILKCYEEYFNKESANFTYEDGILYNKEKQDTNRYKIEITIKVKDQANPKSFRLLKCTAILHDDDAETLTVEENRCDDGTSGGQSTNDATDVSSELEYSQDETTELSTTESDVGRQALDLDSEVQSDNAQINSSGEQFVAIPRPQPSSPCIGCSSLVDSNAPGVEELANLAIRHLNKHTPDVTYKRKSILQVERQVQIVNGVRYILTIDVSDLNCVETQEEDCSTVKTCKVSILEKPWLKIPNGKKFRAVLSNNCTEQWLFGEDGEEFLTKDDDVTNPDDEVIKVNRNIDLQAAPNSERKLTGQELKELEDQIIPSNEIERQKRYVNTQSGVEVVLEPKSPYLLDLAIKAFERYSSKKSLQLRVVYATRLSSVDSVITRINFNVKVLESTVEDATNEVNMRCHTRISKNIVDKKSFYTYCKQLDEGLADVIEMPASDPKYRTVALEKLRSEYGKLLQFDEVVRVYVIVGAKFRQNIIFDAKSSENNVYRCYFISQENFNMPSLVCKKVVLHKSMIYKADGKVKPRTRSKRKPGSKNHRDPKNEIYLSLAKKSLSQYLDTENVETQYNITVEEVTTQLVAGISTDIYFSAIPIDNSGGHKCHSNVWERGWIRSSTINVKCIPLQPLGRQKREDKLVGGKTAQDPNSPEYLTLARTSLNQYLKEENMGKQFQIIVKNVTTQVVAGNSIEIDFIAKYLNSTDGYKCHSNIWERVWLKSTIIKVNCSPLYQEIGKRTIRNIQTNIQKDPSDPKYLDYAEKSLSQYLRLDGPSNQYQITVEQVTITKVSGLLTTIHFISVDKRGFNILGCNSTIWEQAWLNSTKIEVKCNPLPREERSIYDIDNDADLTENLKYSRIKRSNSDKQKYDDNNPTIDNEAKADHLANQALKYINAKYRHPRQMKVISIFSFTKDHTSAHYTIKMEVGYTNCLALSPIVGTCSLVSDMGANKLCRVSVWVQPKEDHSPRFRVSCDIDENLIEINKKTQAEHLFFDFLVAHKPAYLNDFEEMRRRLEIFKQNIEKIHELNTHERGTARYAVSKFSDLTDVEFKTKYLGLKPNLASSNSMAKAKIPNVALPASFDWREKGAVTEVKNQGQCGSCWAFSVTGNIEGQWKLKSGQLVSLSEQELVDCDTVDQGCSGGLPDNAYRAIEQLGGLETEQDYPYEAQNDKCTYNKTLSKVQISGAVNITANETSMAMWMVEHGPISIGINANGMQFYMGGVSHPWKVLCNPKNLDHGVLIVGYGIKEYPLFKKKLPYWIIKNSWGPSWGEQGYYRIYRGDGACGVDQMASSAVIN